MNPHLCSNSECTLRFKTKNELYQHQSTVHSMAPLCSCKLCGKSFASKQALGGHMSAKHRKSRRPVSRSNGLQRKRFRSMPSAQSLATSDLVPRPWVCPEAGCGRTYTRRDLRDSHYRDVHDGYPWPCNHADCGQTFKCKDELNKHENRAHAGHSSNDR